MDANGNEQFISQFASLLRGDELSPTDIEWGNAKLVFYSFDQVILWLKRTTRSLISEKPVT